MATKRARTSGKKVKSLRAKSLSGKKAKGVQAGQESVTRGQVSAADGSVNKLINIRYKEPAY